MALWTRGESSVKVCGVKIANFNRMIEASMRLYGDISPEMQQM